MNTEKKLKILRAIRDNEKFSRNNRDMAHLHANGYIECEGVENCSYVRATIRLTEYGHYWARERNEN